MAIKIGFLTDFGIQCLILRVKMPNFFSKKLFSEEKCENLGKFPKEIEVAGEDKYFLPKFPKKLKKSGKKSCSNMKRTNGIPGLRFCTQMGYRGHNFVSCEPVWKKMVAQVSHLSSPGIPFVCIF